MRWGPISRRRAGKPRRPRRGPGQGGVIGALPQPMGTFWREDMKPLPHPYRRHTDTVQHRRQVAMIFLLSHGWFLWIGITLGQWLARCR